MLESALVWIIYLLGILDLIILISLLGHHFFSDKSRFQRSESKNRVLISLQNAVETGDFESLNTSSPRDYPVIAEALQILSTSTLPNRNRLGETLERIGYVNFYLNQLSSRWWWLRAEAAFALGESRTDRVLPALIEAMNDGALEVRLKAATALALLGYPEAVSSLAKRLPSLGFVSVEWLKDIFFLILQDKPELLNEMLFSIDEPLIKKSLVEVAGEIENIDTAPLIKLISNEFEELEIKISAVKSLGRLKSMASEVEKILFSDDWQLRAVAAKALGEIGDSASAPVLGRMLGDPNWWVRVNSAHSLIKLNEAGINELEQNLDATDAFAQDIARQALAEIGIAKVGSSHG